MVKWWVYDMWFPFGLSGLKNLGRRDHMLLVNDGLYWKMGTTLSIMPT